jgi:hypothetical protein
MKVKSFFGHLKTVVHHKNLVFIHCRQCGIPFQGIRHDLSKFSPVEFIPGVKYFQGNRSPNTKERELIGYSAAWLHHKGRNKHHFEYWTDYNLKTKTVSPVKMPKKYVIEMFCDRVAASKTYLKDEYTQKAPLMYYENSTAKRCSLMNEETSELLKTLLTELAENGEDSAFRLCRKILKSNTIAY